MKEVLENTTNRGEFNRVYKKHLENTGKIRCTYCKYHRNENFTGGVYGGWVTEEKVDGIETEGDIHNIVDSNITHPNWKLVSKNRKQWMKTNKTYTFKRHGYRYNNQVYVEISW